MSRPAADRNLLFGILALQMDFIGRDALIQGLHTWVLDKARTLGEILEQEEALRPDHRALIEGLVEAHLKQHENDPHKSLAAVSSIGSARKDLEQIADADFQASLVQVSIARLGEDPWKTRPHQVGEATSVGSRFRVLRPHAKGGLGEVFVAEDAELRREVALKEIQDRHADNASSRARFILEAEITDGLEHPGIVPVYGLGHYADGRPFYAMRFIRGDRLKDAIERFHAQPTGRFSSKRAVEFRKLLSRFLDVCNAIAYAHSRGVLHRDLKPGNIMLGKYGETLVVDWGLAKAAGATDDSTAEEPPLQPSSASGTAETAAGSAIGTPQYMSPEQASGRADQLGPATDVYGLGSTLFALLTGKPPFTGADVGAVLQKVQRGDFPAPRQMRSEVPPALEAICLKAMALKPEERYPTPRALADDVEHWLADEPVIAYRERWTERVGRWMRRHRTKVTAALALLTTAVIGLIVGLVILDRKQAEVVRERNAAQRSRDEERALTRFYEENVLTAPRPVGWGGGAGRNVTLKAVLDQAGPKIGAACAGQPELEAAVRDTLGMTYWHLGEFEAANNHLEIAYATRRETLGEDHHDTLTSLHHLARLRWRQGKFGAAVTMGRQALEGRRRVLGPEHVDTLWTEINLGQFLADQGQLEEADSLLRHGIEGCQHILGPDHHHPLYGQADLAGVLAQRDKLAESEKLCRQTLERQRRLFGAEHRNTLKTQSSLARLLGDRGELAEAEALYRVTLEGQRRTLGAEYPSTLSTQEGLADVLGRQGKRIESEEMFREVLAARRRTLLPDHPDLAGTLAGLGSFLAANNRPAEAEPLFRECLAIREKQLPPTHWRTADVRSQLGSALTTQRRFAEAEPLLLAGYEGLARTLAPGSRVAQAISRVAWLYEMWEKPDQAAAWQMKAKQTIEKTVR